MSRILIVDDEASICWAFSEFLTDEGHVVDVAASAEEGLKVAAAKKPDALVLDVRLPGIDGLTAMRSFRDLIGGAPIVVVTAFGNLETAVRAMEGGAFDYLVKPFDLDQASSILTRALEKSKPADRPTQALALDDAGSLLGSSPVMQDLFKKIALVAPADVPVLITGESGTGKELVARAIHRHSRRHRGPFLPVCLAALSPSLVERELFGHLRGSFTGAGEDRKGLLELATGGTVLLDEIGDVPPSLQVKLLRAIEHREVTPVGDARPRITDIRIVAATNRPLSDLMASGEFREDLFFRLSVFQIQVPPLRERREDIPVIAGHFLRQARGVEDGSIVLSDETLRELQSRPWVGNVRELRNTIEHAAIVSRGREIRVTHLPPPSTPGSTGQATRPDQEVQDRIVQWTSQELREAPALPEEHSLHERFLELTEAPLIKTVLEQCGGNRAAAAQRLGIHRATLRQKLRNYGIG
ncbi:sigma-54-dependent transcriptional regulator [Singulisphaera sp. PoT]|uniref:sigma-54-dependent transcriptional regulator n=1 Tax=Singulisphaera sp. PoT TaxID=3411797 RepID=UPI003BF503FB